MSIVNKKAYIASCMSSSSQAAIINLPALLFVMFNIKYGVSYAQLGALVLIIFIIQLLVDLIMVKIADKLDPKLIVSVSLLTSILGIVIFTLSPNIFGDNIYIGLLIGVGIASIGAGALETIVSPIVAYSSENEPKAMNIAHSFYGWGQVAVVLLTTVALLVFGYDMWQIIAVSWVILPLIAFIFWQFSDLSNLQKEEESTDSHKKSILTQPFFLLCILMIFGCGAVEQIVAQWSSAFMEAGIGIPKIYGDLFGTLMFALMLALGRMLIGSHISKDKVYVAMIISGVASAICFVLMAFGGNILACIGCALAGFSISLAWPTSVSIASNKYPKAGTILFAFMAVGGDIGCSVGPYLTGLISDISIQNGWMIFGNQNETGLRIGLAVGIIFAIIFAIVSFVLYKLDKRDRMIDEKTT